MENEMVEIKKILLVEDDPNDMELTLAGLQENNLANTVAVVRDGDDVGSFADFTTSRRWVDLLSLTPTNTLAGRVEVSAMGAVASFSAHRK